MARSHFHSIERTKHCVEVSEDEGRGGGEGEGGGESRPIHREGAEATEECLANGRTHGRTNCSLDERTDGRTGDVDGGCGRRRKIQAAVAVRRS